MPAMTNRLWRAPVNVARKDPLPLLGADSSGVFQWTGCSRGCSSDTQGITLSYPSAVGRQWLVASRSLNLLHRNLLKCACGAKQGAAVVEPLVILIPQKRKFMHRWNKRTCCKAQRANIFSVLLSCYLTAVKHLGSVCCPEASNTTQSLK